MIFVRELAHLFTARAAGVPGKMSLSTRLQCLVAQADVSGIWSAPRRIRMTVYLPGMVVNALLAVAALTLHNATPPGGLHNAAAVLSVLQPIMLAMPQARARACHRRGRFAARAASAAAKGVSAGRMTGGGSSGHSSGVRLRQAEENLMSVLSVLAAQAASPVCTTAAECAGQGVDTFIGTPERVWASVAALVALGGVVIGWLALRSARRTGDGRRRGAIVALAAGLVGGLNGAANLAVADGGLGTGNGVFGGASALLLGLAGATLGGLALARSRRAGLSG
ncbi:DUF6223 family protein [Nonomuraea deserti]|nr:DUF6223 family protein [Nonomuraea deserti]